MKAVTVITLIALASFPLRAQQPRPQPYGVAIVVESDAPELRGMISALRRQAAEEAQNRDASLRAVILERSEATVTEQARAHDCAYVLHIRLQVKLPFHLSEPMLPDPMQTMRDVVYKYRVESLQPPSRRLGGEKVVRANEITPAFTLQQLASKAVRLAAKDAVDKVKDYRKLDYRRRH